MPSEQVESTKNENDEVVESAENFVINVESELQERLEESRKKSKEAAKKQTNNRSKKDHFVSPPVIGADLIKKPLRSDEEIKLELASELPNGKKNLYIDAPNKDDITDDSHKLNRLLSYYNISIENISDLIGKKIPIKPKRNLKEVDSDTKYIIDYPRIGTIPNKIVYKLKRIGLYYGVLRWGKQTRYGKNQPDNTYVSDSASPISELYLKYGEEGTVLTERGAQITTILGFSISIFLMLSVFFTEYLFAVTFYVMGLLLFILSFGINAPTLRIIIGRMKESFKNRFFPK